MTDKITRFAIVALSTGVLLFAYFLFQETRPAFASAPSGLPATFATTTKLTIGPTVTINAPLAGTSTAAEYLTQCAARIVSTVGVPIMLQFEAAASTTASATVGHTQAASTTVAYDSGQYGCGEVTAFAFSTTTITVTETR